ncbi:acyl-CoA reductase-like NAD-dependent aldehyde dehydrogenase [Pseudomonas baetica]|nr:acyl-CoA reductase-like NAD-dependent aldehyde dehydrogenase [Pseudomonas baetica]
MITVGHLINGQIVTDTERTQDVFNPATGEVTKQVALASKQTVENAIAAAEAAFPEWRNTPPIKRARVMFRFKELLEQNAERICQMIGEEHGENCPRCHGRASAGHRKC